MGKPSKVMIDFEIVDYIKQNLIGVYGKDVTAVVLNILNKEIDKIRSSKKKNSSKDSKKGKSVYFSGTHSFVEALMKHNENSDDKIQITQSLIRRETGGNANSIKRYLEMNKNLINRHHKKYGIDSKTNVKFRNKTKYPRIPKKEGEAKGKGDKLFFINDILEKYKND